MAKILSRRLKPKDDPMFSGGLETFSIRRSKKSSTSTAKSTTGATPKTSPTSSPLEQKRPPQSRDGGGR